MKCPNCGFDSPPEMKYCGQCGARLGRVCPSCNFVNPLDYGFCGMCGARLEEPALRSLPIASEDSGLVVPPAKPLVGERRVATVIVADVRSSTDLMEQIGTEAWVQLMNRALQILEAQVYRFGGQVDQFRGDGLVAFFSATSAHEDDPERAVLAALSMQQAIRSYAAELAERKGIDLKLRVGVNTGEVIVTRVGNPSQHEEDTAMGEAVALAARMEAAAEPGTVLVSENTFRLTEANFTWRPLGEILVKGMSKPIPVFQPLGPRADVEWLHDSQAYEIPARVIGRDAEFQAFIHCLQDLCGGRGGIVLVTGEKGMGKSFLVTQARRYLVRQEAILAQARRAGKAPPSAISKEPPCPTATWLHGNCRSYDQSTPYSMWSDMLRNWLDMQANEADQDLQSRLYHQAQALWGDQQARHYPYLATLLSLPLDGANAEQIRRLNAEGLQQRVAQAIYSWVEVLAKRTPLALVFNDMQWADTSSLGLLRHCLPLCDSDSVLWVIVFRPDRTSPIWDFYHYIETEYPHRLTHIDLPPLSDLKSRELVDQLLGHAALPEETLAFVIQRAEGNPYYIQEIVQSLIAQGVLVRNIETGGWQQTRPVTSLDLPSSLQSLLLARLDRLRPEERQVLQKAAVIGPVFWRNVLTALVDDAIQLRTCLTGLQRAGLIQERTQDPALGMEYAFTSLLIRDVAYDSLLSHHRAACHLKVAERLEEITGPEFRKPYHGLLAYHYRLAGNPNKELYYALGAAEEARKVYANVEAIEQYTRALELLDEIESAVQDKRQVYSIYAMRFEALNGRREVYYTMGNINAGRVDSRALLPLAQQMADDPVWMIDALLAQPEVTGPDSREELSVGLDMAQQALASAQQLGDRRREMNSLVAVARARLALKAPDWQSLAERALELARQLGDVRMEVSLLLGIAGAYGIDDLPRSKEYLEAALALCQSMDDKAIEMALLGTLSPQFERNGDYYRQLTEYEQKWLAISREIGNRMEEGRALMSCGQIQALYLGDYEGGLALMRQSLRLWEESTGRLFPLLRIAQIQTALGQYDEAQATLERAHEISERVVHDIGRAGWGLVAAILYNALGDEAHLRLALELASKVARMATDGLVSRQYQMAAACESAAAHLGLARRLTDDAERREHLQQALESSRTALGLYSEFGFVQIVECVSEEILYRHSLALSANGYQSEAHDCLKRAYNEMMRKHNLIPADSPFHRTYLENIALHREIRASYRAAADEVED